MKVKIMTFVSNSLLVATVSATHAAVDRLEDMVALRLLLQAPHHRPLWFPSVVLRFYSLIFTYM